MTKSIKDPAAYVQRIREETQRYIQDLLSENERLQRLTASLEGQQREGEQERVRLCQQVAALQLEIDRFRGEQESIRQRLTAAERDNQQFSSQYVEVEQRNSDLANLYVASYRLHSTLDRVDVFAAIQEILINLIGSEEFGIFELSTDGERLTLVSSFGIDETRYGSVSLDSGVIARATESGSLYLDNGGAKGGEAHGDFPVTACIPLKVDGRVTGAIVIFRLLPQKGGRLAPLDGELFEILATQAGAAVFCSSLAEKFGWKKRVEA